MKTQIFETLKRYFGYNTLQKYQEEIIMNILEGRDTLAVMPTEAGRTLCYQLPAIMNEGTSIVVSPYSAFMKDQVGYLDNIGIKAVCLYSSLTPIEFREKLQEICENQYKIIYTSPEKLETEEFLDAICLLKRPCTQLMIDEAHSVSAWDHDFRPGYTKIIDFVNQLSMRPAIAAFTAAATDAVREDIEKVLGLKEPLRFITGFDRKNLEFKVKLNTEKDRFVKEFMKKNPGETGIIYTATRKEAEHLNHLLKKEQINSTVYHAGMSPKLRDASQADFIYDNIPVMIAANTLGMGMDKPNIRFVIHYNMPGDLETYYQQIGHAGRDGLPSVCILLYSTGDYGVQKYFIDEGNISEDRKTQEYEKLRQMEEYCHTDSCLRKYMLEYFGDYSSPGYCGNCSVCNHETVMKDVTFEALMILSSIHRSGQKFGRSMIVDILRGSRSRKIISFGFDEMKAYGLMSGHSKESIELLVHQLTEEGYIYKTEEHYPSLKLTDKARPVLKNRKAVIIQVMKEPGQENAEEPLLLELKRLRKEIALREGYSPFVVFQDSVLMELVRTKPGTLDEFVSIKGVGENRKSKYGEEILQVINDYREQPSDSLSKRKELMEALTEENDLPVGSFYERQQTEAREPQEFKESAYKSYAKLHKEGMDMAEIAVALDVNEATVEINLLKAYREGEEITIDDFIQKEYESAIASVMLDDEWDGKLKYIKDKTPREVTYRTIRAAIEKLRRRLVEL